MSPLKPAAVIDLPPSAIVAPTPAEALLAVSYAADEGLELSEAISDPARVSWTNAIRIIHDLREKLAEIKAVVAESGCVRE